MEVPRHWRMKKQRYAMVGEICPACKSAIFPPRAVCPTCEEKRLEVSPYMQRATMPLFAKKAEVVEG